MQKIYNWGIIGLGKIANKFAQDISSLPNAKVYAVASRSLEKAQQFAQQYEANYAYGSYEELMQCPNLDVVYIATPHVFHKEHSLLCLGHNIPVLCEKPFALNRSEVDEMIQMARQTDTFLMEALWTRFLPTTKKILSIIESGQLGKIYAIKADFGFKAAFDPDGRLYNPHLAGGSLLDIGIYPVFLALLLLGPPDDLKAFAKFSTTGVDEECQIIFNYQTGQTANLHSTIRSLTKTEAFIYGEKGSIHIHTRWHEPSSFTLIINDQRPKHFQFNYTGNGYYFEAEEVMQCLEDQQKESQLLPLDFSVQLIQLLDRIRKEISLSYPNE